MLNVIAVILEGADRGGAVRSAESVRRQGFLSTQGFIWEGGELMAWTHPSAQGAENCEVRTPAGIACCVGPIWYRKKFGRAALALALEEMDRPGSLDEAQLRGNYALFLRTSTQCLLLNDALGFVRIYASADGRFYSTSWLATCAYTDSVELNEVAAVEYVLLGASHSCATVARSVTTLPSGFAFDLTVRGRRTRRIPRDAWNEPQGPSSFQDAVDKICAHLKLINREVATAFAGRTRAALSGGFDSRLIVAGLLDAGNHPELFVYGQPTSDDVMIAKSVAASARLPLALIDKGALNHDLPEPSLERLVGSALFFDGLPTDGIYDPGSDQQTRLDQTAQGYLVLNGGGGEIFRNYFHLPDRTFRATDIVQAFYRGFDPKVFRGAGALRAYREQLATSMLRSLGLDDLDPYRVLTRAQVELLYPKFRCHHWMSVNNSIGVRHGYYATPLVDLATVQLTCGLPLAWKNAGLLESRLIMTLDSGMASQPSAYGFRFADGPGWCARASDWATRMRPISLRPCINAVHRRVGKARVSATMVRHCRSLLPGEWRLEPVLDLGRLPGNGAFARALAIEVVWRELVA